MNNNKNNNKEFIKTNRVTGFYNNIKDKLEKKDFTYKSDIKKKLEELEDYFSKIESNNDFLFNSIISYSNINSNINSNKTNVVIKRYRNSIDLIKIFFKEDKGYFVVNLDELKRELKVTEEVFNFFISLYNESLKTNSLSILEKKTNIERINIIKENYKIIYKKIKVLRKKIDEEINVGTISMNIFYDNKKIKVNFIDDISSKEVKKRMSKLLDNKILFNKNCNYYNKLLINGKVDIIKKNLMIIVHNFLQTVLHDRKELFTNDLEEINIHLSIRKYWGGSCNIYRSTDKIICFQVSINDQIMSYLLLNDKNYIKLFKDLKYKNQWLYELILHELTHYYDLIDKYRNEDTNLEYFLERIREEAIAKFSENSLFIRSKRYTLIDFKHNFEHKSLYFRKFKKTLKKVTKEMSSDEFHNLVYSSKDYYVHNFAKRMSMTIFISRYYDYFYSFSKTLLLNKYEKIIKFVDLNFKNLKDFDKIRFNKKFFKISTRKINRIFGSSLSNDYFFYIIDYQEEFRSKFLNFLKDLKKMNGFDFLEEYEKACDNLKIKNTVLNKRYLNKYISKE